MPKTPLRLVARVRSFAGTHPIAALALIAGVGLASAAVTVTYTTASTVATTVVAAPVQFESGTDSAISRYITAYSISSNGTYFTSTVAGVPEATVAVGSYVKIHNVDSASHAVTLSTTQVTASGITAYTLEILDQSSASQGTLTFTAGSPSVSFTVPAGQTWTGKLTLTLGSGAGLNNAVVSRSVTMSVT